MSAIWQTFWLLKLLQTNRAANFMFYSGHDFVQLTSHFELISSVCSQLLYSAKCTWPFETILYPFYYSAASDANMSHLHEYCGFQIICKVAKHICVITGELHPVLFPHPNHANTYYVLLRCQSPCTFPFVRACSLQCMWLMVIYQWQFSGFYLYY